MSWQLQTAKQKFSELVDRAETDGPQVVTRHGKEVAVVVSIGQYRELLGHRPDFKAFLRSTPDLDALDLVRRKDRPRAVAL